LRQNLSKFVTQTGLYCSKQLETTFNQLGKKLLHITFKSVTQGTRSSEALEFKDLQGPFQDRPNY